MDEDIRTWVAACHRCSQIRPRSRDESFHWPASSPWTRLHMDWAHIPSRGNILIVVDSGSGWIEAFPCKERSSQEIIECLRQCFCRFGIPTTLVSDNAKEFTSTELASCHQTFTPIYNPRSNGVAERAVQTVKSAMRAWIPAMGSFDAFLNRVLLNHRNSPSSSRDGSPAEILLGRSLRVPVISRFSTGQSIVFNNSLSQHRPEPATFLINKGRNTAWIVRDGGPALASTSQLSLDPIEPSSNGCSAPNPAASEALDSPTPQGEMRLRLRDRQTIPKPIRYI